MAGTTGNDLVKLLGLRQPLLSKPPAGAREVGLVECADEGRQRIYRLTAIRSSPSTTGEELRTVVGGSVRRLDGVLEELKGREEWMVAMTSKDRPW